MNAEYDSKASYLNQQVLPSLDGLRAVSIILVVIAHLFFEGDTELKKSDIGVVGVEIFFVISGFLITTLLLKEKAKNGRISLKNFYIRRCLRILPPVYLFLFILFFLNIIFELQLTPFNFLTAALFIENLPFKAAPHWYTAHFWSLGVEEQYYLIFPFFLSTLKLSKYVAFVAALICFLPLISYLGYHKIGIFYSNHIVHLISFVIIDIAGVSTALILVGSLVAIALFYNEGFFKRFMGNWYLSLAILLLAFIVRVPLFHVYIPYLSDIIFGLLIGFCIVLNLDPGNLLGKFLNKKFMIKIGVLSYSIYIWQQVFTYSQPWRNISGFFASRLFNVCALFIVAYLSYYFFERKFISLRGKFKV